MERPLDFNHFMLLLDLGEPFMEEEVVDVEAVAAGDASCDRAMHFMRRGKLLIKTIAQGDCGVDCIAAFEGWPRDPLGWLNVRLDLASWLRKVSRQRAWQFAYMLAGELPPVVPPASSAAMRFYYTGQARPCRFARPPMRWGTGAAAKAGSKPLPPQRPTAWKQPLKPTLDLDAAASDVAAVMDLDSVASDTDSQQPLAELGGAGSLPASASVAPPCDHGPADAGDFEGGAGDGGDANGSTNDGVAEELDMPPVSREELLKALSWASGVQTWHEDSAENDMLTLWFQEMDPRDLATYVHAHREFLNNAKEKEAMKSGEPPTLKVMKRRYVPTKCDYRLWVGRKICDWMKTEAGKNAKRKRKHLQEAGLQVFNIKQTRVPKNVTNFFGRCLQMSERYDKAGKRGAGRPLKSSQIARGSVPFAARYRDKGMQGRPRKIPEIFHVLFQWVIDIRLSVRTRLWPRDILAQAHVFLLRACAHIARQGYIPDPPKLNSGWMQRFLAWSGYNWRKPTKRYKVTFPVAKSRSKLYWINDFALRQFFYRLLGIDPDQELFDQTGCYKNECSSKNVGTLEIPGRVDIPLLDNHAEARERITLMVACFSCLARAGRPVPLDTTFKLKTEKCLEVIQRTVITDPDRYTLQASGWGWAGGKGGVANLTTYVDDASSSARSRASLIVIVIVVVDLASPSCISS